MAIACDEPLFSMFTACRVLQPDLAGSVQVEGAMDAANILKPALARGTLRCIGATTFAEHAKHIAPDGALARRLQPVVVDEPSPAESRVILAGLQPCDTQFHYPHAVAVRASQITGLCVVDTWGCVLDEFENPSSTHIHAWV